MSKPHHLFINPKPGSKSLRYIHFGHLPKQSELDFMEFHGFNMWISLDFMGFHGIYFGTQVLHVPFCLGPGDGSSTGCPRLNHTAPSFCLHLLQGSFPPIARHDLESNSESKDPKI